MKFRVIALCLVSLSLIGSSFFVESALFKPQMALEMASNYETVTSRFCVESIHSNFLDVRVEGGDLPSGARGMISTERNFELGDCLEARLSLRPAESLGRFAFRGQLRQVLGDVRHSVGLALVNEIRSRFRNLNGDSQNLVAGLAVGMDQGLSKEFVSSMKLTGLTHLTAVSGANCAIVIGMVWVALRRFPIHKTIRTMLALLALVLYVALVGPEPSVLRAAFMMSVVFVALELGRKIWLPRALLIGSTLLLVVDPWFLIDYGFWLSVLATYGLVTLTPTVAKSLENYLPKPLALLIAGTLAATIWCLPVLANLQGGFTTYSVLANLLVEPVVAVITVLGILAALAGVLAPMLFHPLVGLASFFASWIVAVALSLSALPANLLPIPSGLIGTLVLIAFVAIFSFGVVKHRNFLASLLMLCLLAGWISTLAVKGGASLAWPPKGWTVVSCNVGQGDATVISSLHEIALIDTGKEPELIDTCLDRLGVKRIDLLVLTHFDADHVAGLAGALRGRSVESALISPFRDDRPLAVTESAALNSVAGQVIAAQKNLAGTLGNFHWSVISSLGDQATTSNEGSLGILFASATLSIYTLADLNEAAQCRISVIHESVPTIVKVSHHGSADQCPRLYETMKPELALISVGRANSYGHPTRQTLKLLDGIDARVFRTDESGSIAVSQNPKTLDLSVSVSG